MRSRMVLIALLVLTTAGAFCQAETIAEYVPTSSEPCSSSGSQSLAQAFEVIGTAIVTEIQLELSRSTGSETGTVTVELHRADPDDCDNPSPTVSASVSLPVTSLAVGSDAASWVSFLISPGLSLDPPPTGANKWWIVLKQTSYADQINWHAGSASYGPMGDCMSADAGMLWNLSLLQDNSFRVYGTRSSLGTQMFITLAADPVTPGYPASIDVEVDDCWGNPVPGKPEVHFSAPDGGTLRATDPTLVDGKANNAWTSPTATTGTFTVNVSLDGYSCDCNDYDAVSGSTTIHVQDPDISTIGALTLTHSVISTRQYVDATFGPVQYWDVVNEKWANVPTGTTVSFNCTPDGMGTFTSQTVAVGTDGKATARWTAGNKVGYCQISATYNGGNVSGWLYGSCTDSPKDLEVVYTDVFTSAPTVSVSPDYPYIGKHAWVTAEVKQTTGEYVPCGTVRLTASAGSFQGSGSTVDLDISGGTAVKYWTAPSATGDVTFTAIYQGGFGSGNFYNPGPVSSPATAHVTKDPDTSGDSTKMTWCTEYTTHYSWWRWGTTPDLPQAKTDSQDFSAALTAQGWAANGEGSKENGNDKSWQKDFIGDSDVDLRDLTYYAGHGHNGGCITFNNSNDNDELCPDDAYDSWGDEDADWIALFSCKALSNPGWAKCMKGLHLLCGFTSDAWSVGDFGKAFGGLLVKHGPQDEPHTIVQSWFLACDETSETDRGLHQIVMQPNDDAHDTFDDYVWGQGFVQHDPDHREGHYDIHSDWTALTPPVADPGGDANNWYYGVAGEAVEFDGSGSYCDDDPGDYLTYIWDFNTDQDTDSGDYDNDPDTTTDDDCDAIGPHPRYIFPSEGQYGYRLIVRCRHWLVSSRILGSGTVKIDEAPGKALNTASRPASDPVGSLEIVDRFETANLPTVTELPVFDTLGATIGYNEMASIAQTYNMHGALGLNVNNNWNIVRGNNELTVNRDAGSVAYIDRSRAYTYTGTPYALPDQAACQTLANNWLNANGISRDGAVLGRFTDIYRDSWQPDTRQPQSSVPFQRRVTYRRSFEVDGNHYPAVGPGGKIIVLLDYSYDPGMFIKVWRSAQQGVVMPLRTATDVVADFHRLGPAITCYGGSPIPLCNRILIDNVSIGYYEAGFMDKQDTIPPVYVLDLTCQDEEGSQQTRVYLPAIPQPLEVSITSPADDASVPYGQDISFSGSAAGGATPYTFEWFSDVDGLLGMGPALSRTLSGYNREGHVLKHTITLRVTDRDGIVGTRSISVMVSPQKAADVRKLDPNAPVWLFDPIVTASFTDPSTGDFFYAESEDRSAGIRVDKDMHNLSIGTRADVTGSVKVNPQGECYIDAASAVANGTGTVAPLGIGNRALGGGSDGIQEEVKDGVGLNNIGLLVRAWGRIVDRDTSVPLTWFTIDDGSGVNVKCLVPSGVTVSPGWEYVGVTAISSCEKVGYDLLRLLKIRDSNDLVGY